MLEEGEYRDAVAGHSTEPNLESCAYDTDVVAEESNVFYGRLPEYNGGKNEDVSTPGNYPYFLGKP